MKILVDAMPFDHGLSGISVYTRHVIQALERAGHEVDVLATQDDTPCFQGSNVITAPRWADGPIGSIFYHAFSLPRLLRKCDHDFCLVAAANRRFPSQCPIPVIGVVHDLAQCRVKGKYDQWRNFYLNHILAKWVRKGAARVVAISHSTKEDIEQYWKIPNDRISVIYNGLSLPEQDEPGFMAHFGLTEGSYILYVSRLEHPGKNHLRLIQAFERLPEEMTRNVKLVLVGSPWKNTDVLENYVANSPLKRQIVLTGFVPAEQLPEAYRGAAVYAFPSCYEGFGLSLVEAMHYGCPCCCSNNSSLGEIGRDAALLFPPDDVDEIRNALQKILENHGHLRESLINAGYARARQFDWNSHATAIVDAFKSLPRNNPAR